MPTQNYFKTYQTYNIGAYLSKEQQSWSLDLRLCPLFAIEPKDVVGGDALFNIEIIISNLIFLMYYLVRLLLRDGRKLVLIFGFFDHGWFLNCSRMLNFLLVWVFEGIYAAQDQLLALA